MAMSSKAMADFIMGKVRGCTEAGEANYNLFNALCDYCEKEMEINYGWVGLDPMSVPDPETSIVCSVKATGSISPCGGNTAESALSVFGNNLNSQISLWQVVWPSGFSLSPALIIPNIVLSPTYAETMEEAWEGLCSQIIKGLKVATPAATGTHSSFTGSATFISIS